MRRAPGAPDAEYPGDPSASVPSFGTNGLGPLDSTRGRFGVVSIDVLTPCRVAGYRQAAPQSPDWR
jgi:hypothetical protein